MGRAPGLIARSLSENRTLEGITRTLRYKTSPDGLISLRDTGFWSIQLEYSDSLLEWFPRRSSH